MYFTHALLQIRPSAFTDNYSSKAITLLIGAFVGFLSGLLGKGGSAITTPALQIFAGINPFAALASPLPATIPTTLSASAAYSREKNLVNKRVVKICILLGIPATFLGSFFSDLLGGNVLMILTALFVLTLGLSFFFITSYRDFPTANKIPQWKIIIVAISVGFLSGLLANSGGVLFGPLFIRFLKMPTKQALASSLLVAAGLAIPGTIAHWYLGHINWQVVLFLSVSSIPFSYAGARVALLLSNLLLEKIFGTMLIIFGAFDLWYNIAH